MRQTLSRGVFAAAAATSMLTLCGSSALADSHADGAASNSPGVLSGNTIQAPVSVPVNVCGNTVNVVAALNPTFGNGCANGSPAPGPVPVTPPEPGVTPPTGGGSTTPPPPATTPPPPATTPPPPGTTPPPPGTPTPTPAAETPTTNTPPRVVDEPVDEPVDELVDEPVDELVDEPVAEPQRAQTLPAPAAFEHATTDAAPQLAETGTGALLASSAASAALIAGGVILYRRGRAASHR
ncbi:chaplin [Streptomyces sp. NPDC001698]|uniref:chaplin n=1 Tax=unclassified Streptomyces TaxID=2593676 RepID=UPI0036A5CCB4